MTRSPKGVTVSGLEINPVNAVHMFLHHLQLAVSSLEATDLNEQQVCEQINGTGWTGMSPQFQKFADTVAHGCFAEFEWDQDLCRMLTVADAESDLSDIPGIKVFTLDPSDPDSVKKFYENFGQIFGQ